MYMKKIFGFEDWDYEIDLETGDVYSLNYHQSGIVCKLEPQITDKGYYRVTLCKDNKVKVRFVHRLVWTTYNQMKVPKGMQVNHIDEIKSNNSFKNLNLLPPKGNSNWGTRNQRISESMKGNTNGRFSRKYTFEYLSNFCTENNLKTSGELNKFNHNLYMVAYRNKWLSSLFH